MGLNSLGSLKQKQKDYRAAEKFYEQALNTRKRVKAVETSEVKEKHQMLAQSHVSLGNLLIEMEHYEKALEHLTQAKAEYEEGFSKGHPKVAWALEAIGKAYQQMGQLRKADEAMAEAIAIRGALMEGAEGKELFAKELHKAKVVHEEISTRRSEVRLKLQDMKHKTSSPNLMRAMKGLKEK